MEEILKTLSTKELVFKGGSALLFGYGLDRFSEDLDFDSPYNITAKSLINMLKPLKFSDVNIKKDTQTTKRVIVMFDDVSIKLEVSLRDSNYSYDKKPFLNKMSIYTIDALSNMKLDAFENRTTARDLFDLGFILYEKHNELTTKTKERFLKTFKNVDFIDLLLSREAAFKEDSILSESDLFESITRLKKGIESVS